MKIYRTAEYLQRHLGQLHKTRFGVWTNCQDNLAPRIQEFILEAWIAYSTPVPSNFHQLLSLFLMCSCIAASVGSLFYCWMFSSLQYSFQFSAISASIFSFLALWVLFLVHPVRCMFTIIVPTLGTKQGRRLLLSACFMTVAVNIIPNIMSNIKTILQVIKCICKASSESLLNTTFLLGNASSDFSHALKSRTDDLPDKFGRTSNSPVMFETHNNSFLLSQKMTDASHRIMEDFMHIEVFVQKVILLANRVSAVFFLCFLVYESASYLRSYLTDLRFDNIYITKKLEDLAQERKATHLLVCSPRKLIKSTGLRLTREELMTCLTHIFLLSLVLLFTLVIIGTDYIAFHLAQAAVTEVIQFPVVPINFWIKYEVKLNFIHFLGKVFNNDFSIEQSKPSFERSYHQNLTFLSDNCSMRCPNPPNTAVMFAVGLLYCIIYAMLFLETYSHRLCRKIAASFFENQEDQRVQYLYEKLERKQKKKEQQE
ncbi:osteoclast stimulatory transmembrane protein [Sceloporus undulatus]|uniref:osteoclast stimulatory transmembrane protein n=1 Tax=Sceloporus undulatus TaxID=8520 RepID=UPI001C4C1E74|nr:osteoclast stimulatory transmembrane protein [Sceloporus undulatus]